MSNTILAIDPGYDRVGVAIIETGSPSKLLHSECIITDKKDAHEKRLTKVFEEVASIIEKWSPDYLAVETIFFSVNKKTVIGVAEARGVILLTSGLNNIPLIELSPQEVKLAMAGVGNASKDQVKKMVNLTLKIDLNGKLDDEIDAIALGFAAAENLRVADWQS